MKQMEPPILTFNWKRDLNTTIYILVGMILIALLAATQHYIRYGNQLEDFSFGLNLTYQLIVFGSISLLALPVFYTVDRFPVNSRNSRPSILIHVVFSIGFGLLHGFICNVILYVTDLAPQVIFPRFWWKYLTTIFHFWLLSYVVLVAIRSNRHKPADEAAEQASEEKAELFIFDKVIIPLQDIIFLEAYDHYVKIHTAHKVYIVRGSLKEVFAQLPSNRFCRVHRSFIVQLSMVRKHQPDRSGGLQLDMKGGKGVRASRSYRKPFEEKLGIIRN